MFSKLAVAVAALSLAPGLSSAADVHLYGEATNLFNNAALEKENFPNRVYADVVLRSEDDTDRFGNAAGVVGSGPKEADDDGIFHFQARCWAVKDDYVLIGAHLVQMPNPDGGAPDGNRRELQKGCGEDNPRDGSPGFKPYEGLDKQDKANDRVKGMMFLRNCLSHFATACCTTPPCAYCSNYYANINYYDKAPHCRRRLTTGDCVDDGTCQAGTPAIYAFRNVAGGQTETTPTADIMDHSRATGFKIQEFDLQCKDFGEVVDSLVWDEMDILLSGGFTQEPLDETLE